MSIEILLCLEEFEVKAAEMNFAYFIELGIFLSLERLSSSSILIFYLGENNGVLIEFIVFLINGLPSIELEAASFNDYN